MVHEALGDLAQVEAQLTLVVALDKALGHPDLESNRAELARIRAMRAEQEGWARRQVSFGPRVAPIQKHVEFLLSSG